MATLQYHYEEDSTFGSAYTSQNNKSLAPLNLTKKDHMDVCFMILEDELGVNKAAIKEVQDDMGEAILAPVRMASDLMTRGSSMISLDDTKRMYHEYVEEPLVQRTRSMKQFLAGDYSSPEEDMGQRLVSFTVRPLRIKETMEDDIQVVKALSKAYMGITDRLEKKEIMMKPLWMEEVSKRDDENVESAQKIFDLLNEESTFIKKKKLHVYSDKYQLVAIIDDVPKEVREAFERKDLENGFEITQHYEDSSTKTFFVYTEDFQVPEVRVHSEGRDGVEIESVHSSSNGRDDEEGENEEEPIQLSFGDETFTYNIKRERSSFIKQKLMKLLQEGEIEGMSLAEEPAESISEASNDLSLNPLTSKRQLSFGGNRKKLALKERLSKMTRKQSSSKREVIIVPDSDSEATKEIAAGHYLKTFRPKAEKKQEKRPSWMVRQDQERHKKYLDAIEEVVEAKALKDANLESEASVHLQINLPSNGKKKQSFLKKLSSRAVTPIKQRRDRSRTPSKQRRSRSKTPSKQRPKRSRSKNRIYE